MAHNKKRFGPVALAAALLAMSATAPRASAEEVLRATTMLPRGVAYTQSFLAFAEKVNKEAKGIVRIQVVGGPEAIPTLEQSSALRSGVIDMLYGPANYYQGEVPEVDALVAGNLTAPELRANGGLDLLNRIHQKKLNAYLLARPEGGHGFHIYLTDEPPMRADGLPDLSGLRIRGAQVYREFFQSLGATYVQINTPEVYTALERGTVSGVGWPSVSLMDVSWDKFLKVRIDPAYFQVDLVVLVNLDRWKAMDEQARTVLQKMAIAYETESMAAFRARAKDEDAELRRRGMRVLALEGAAARRYRALAVDTAWKRMADHDPTNVEALRVLFDGDGE